MRVEVMAGIGNGERARVRIDGHEVYIKGVTTRLAVGEQHKVELEITADDLRMFVETEEIKLRIRKPDGKTTTLDVVGIEDGPACDEGSR